jgi:hypothetical protein
MKNYKKLIIVTGFLLTSCASIVSGTQQSVFIDTPHVNGAECKLTDSKNGSWYLPSTPGSTSILKGNGPLNVVCSKEGYETATVSAEEAVAGATFGNIILGGGIGIFVDAATGAAQMYPDKIIVWMKPKHFASAAERKSWENAKAEYERKLQAEIEAKKKAQQGNNSNVNQ